jgi:hypothetical protein
LAVFAIFLGECNTGEDVNDMVPAPAWRRRGMQPPEQKTLAPPESSEHK